MRNIVSSLTLTASSAGVPPFHAWCFDGPSSAGQQWGVGFPHVFPERPCRVVIQQRVDHAVRRCQTQGHHHPSLQGQQDVAVPAVAHSVQVERADQVIGQKAEQEGHCHHADQMHRAPPVASAILAGQVGAARARVGR